MSDAVLYEVADAVATVTINRPDAMNAADASVRDGLREAFERAADDDEVRAVLLTGAGERAFCAGQDLEEGAGYTIDDVDRWFTEMHSMYAAVRALDKPSVAALFGAVAGAGYQIALYCDLRVAHPEVRIGQPEVKTGLGSILGTSVMDWHLPFGINAELSLMGDFISGERAWQVGIVNHLVPREQVFEKAMDLARALGERPPHAIKITKQRMRELTQPQFDDILVAGRKYQRLAYESGEPQRLMREMHQKMKKR